MLIQVLKLTLELRSLLLQVTFAVGQCLVARLLTAKGRLASSQAHVEPKRERETAFLSMKPTPSHDSL